MAAKQYDLESSVLDWYRDFCPEQSSIYPIIKQEPVIR